MAKFEVWMEGFLVTGMEGVPSGPTRMGIVEANSFQEACDIIGKRPKNVNLYNSEKRSIWGCRLHETLEGASALFKDYKHQHPPTYSDNKE
jgi:hypothetical protein